MKNTPATILHRKHRSPALLLLSLAVLWCVGPAVAQARDAVPAALVVRIEGADIGTPTVALVQRAIRKVSGEGTRYLVLEISSTADDTESMRRVAELLPALQTEELATVAFIDEFAAKAAAMLALGCDQVFVKPNAKIGGVPAADRADVAQQRALMVRALRTTSRDTEQMRTLVAAMVDPELQLWRATYTDGVEQTKVVTEAELQRLRGTPTVRFSVEPVQLRTRPLTVDANEAVDLAIVDGRFDSLATLMSERLLLDSSQYRYEEMSWSEYAVDWLNGMRYVLFVLGFILLLIEFKTPGFALPGILGLAMFALAFLGAYLVGLAQITDILLFFAGLALIVVEIYVMPGFIVFGLAGFVCVVLGLLFSQQKFYYPENQEQVDIMLHNLNNFGLVMLAVMLGIWAVYANIHRIPILRSAVQRPPEVHQPGQPADDYQRKLMQLLGQTGVLATDLRPSGWLDVEGERYDATSEGVFLLRGSRVKVLSVHRGRVVVGPDDTPDQARDSQRGEVGVGFVIMLVLVGLALVIAEVFFVSFGVLAVLSGLSLVSAVFLAFTNLGPVAGWTFLAVCAVGVPLTVKFAFQVLPFTPFGKAFYLSGNSHEEVTGAAQEAGLSALLGARGVAACDLRPSGFAIIGGRRIDVVTRGEPLAKDTPVRVVRVQLNQVVVVSDAQPDTGATTSSTAL